MENLPKHTDAFSEFFNPEAISVAGGVVSVQKTAHGLAVGNLIVVSDAYYLNPVSLIDDSGDNVVMTTANKHDLSPNYQEEVYLTSASAPAIDGWYKLEGVPNSLTFEIATFSQPALTDVVLNECREVGINGLYTVATAPDADNFTFALSVDPLVTMDIGLGTKINSSTRISGASTIQRCINAYEQQLPSDLWGFVILGDNVINKDRYVTTDVDMEQGGGNDWNGLYISPFSFFVFVPIQDKITGREARDTIEDARPAIFKSLLGASFDTGFEHQAPNSVTPRGDNAHEYRKAYYIHEFSFVQTAQIALADTNQAPQTRSWEKVTFDFINIATDNGEVIASAEIDLDTE
jgi:hypothetical protein